MDIMLEKIKQFSSDQYSNQNRLNARIQIYRYSQNKTGWREWLFSHLDFTGVNRVLELGGGNGLLWQVNVNKIPENVQVVLTDISPGMVDAAREKLQQYGDRFDFQVVDVCRIPYPDNTFQMAIASHMLYHVEDKDEAFSEINRVLTPGSYAYATTISSGNWQELYDVIPAFNPKLRLNQINGTRSFNLENGEQVLSGYFSDVQPYIYQNNIVLTSVEPVIYYLASCFSAEQLEILTGNIGKFREYLHDILNKTGKIELTNKSVMFKFRK